MNYNNMNIQTLYVLWVYKYIPKSEYHRRVDGQMDEWMNAKLDG